MSKLISQNNREVLFAQSTATGQAEYLSSTSHALNVNASFSASAIAISDGVDSSIKATVFDLTNSNPLAAQIVDASGTAITSFGGGTQYADGAARGTATGTLAMVDDGTLIQSTKGDTDGTQQVSLTKINGSAITLGQKTMANSLPVVVASDNGLALDATLTGGTQQTKITDGTTITSNIAGDSGQNALVTVGARKEVTFTTTTVQAVASTDASNYKWVSVQITSQGGSSTVTFQVSNDNSNWVNTALMTTNASATNTINTSTTGTGVFHGAVTGRYFRLNVTGIVSGTTAGVVELFANPASHVQINGIVAQSGTWTVGANSATGSAVPANAFYVAVANGSGNLTGLQTASAIADTNAGGTSLSTQNLLYNGTNFDRARDVINATNSVGTGIAAAGILAQFDDASPTAITENQFGNLRMSANRNLYETIRDAAGNERGANVNASNQLSVSVDNSNVSTNIAQIAGNTISTGVGTTGTGVIRTVEANAAGRTLVSTGGSASSSGNNTLVAAGTNKLKVYAFSLSTTSTTAVTCIFQSGASGTELWRVILQAPTSVSTGANLVVPVPSYVFATAAATLLNLNLSGAQTVHWSVAYYDEA